MASRLSLCLRATSPRLLRDAARVHPGRRRRNAGGGVWLSLPQPLWAAPQAGPRASHRVLAGTVAMPSGLPGLGPSSPRSCLIAGATGGPLRPGRSGAASPVGRDHASGAAPCRASATPHRVGAWLPLMAPWRRMLLTPESGLRCCAPTAHGVPAPPRCSPLLPCRLHGAPRGRWRPSAPGPGSALPRAPFGLAGSPLP